MPEIRGFLSKTELRVCFVFLIDRNGLVQTGTKLSDQHLSARLRYGAHPYRPSIQTGRSARRSGTQRLRRDTTSSLSSAVLTESRLGLKTLAAAAFRCSYY